MLLCPPEQDRAAIMPLSRAIREPERDLGVVLFVRTTRQVELTAAGAREPGTGLVGVPFDPPLNFPRDLVSRWAATEKVEALVQTALQVRDSEGWLTERPARTELPRD